MAQKVFSHNVYFWLKEPKNQSACKLFEQSLATFINHSEHIKTKFVGKPAHTDREVVDNSYTYNLLVTFDNKTKHDLYQAEQGHQQFLEQASHLWSKVQIYDAELLDL